MARLIRHAALHVDRVTDLLVTCLRCQISRVRLVGYLIAAQQTKQERQI